MEENTADLIYKKEKIEILIYRILVITVGVLTILFTIYNGAQAIAILIFLLLEGSLLFLRAGLEYGRMRKAYECAPQVLHDYYLKKFQHTKKQKVRNNMLLILAKCDIQMEKFKDAADALNQINYYAMPLMNQASNRLQWAVINKLSGNEEGFEQEVATYEQMCAARKNGLPRQEERLRILRQGSAEELKSLSDIGEALELNNKSMISRGLFFLSMGFMLLLFAGEAYLPYGTEYRTWFEILGIAVTETASFITGILTVVTGVRARKYNGRSATGYTAVWIILLIFMGLALLAWDFLWFLADEEYETKLSDGNILVQRMNFLDPCSYYVAKPQGLILRVHLYDSDENGDYLSAGITESQDNTETYDQNGDTKNPETWNATGNTETSESKEDSEKESETMDQKEESNTDAGEDSEINNIYKKIYDTIYTDTEHGTGISYQISAKGVPYALVGESFEREFMGETVTAQIRLVYDRESTNGLCDEVVCYEYHYDADGNQLDNTSILEFYAVVKKTGEVIAGDKTGWADSGNEKYREATGE